VAGLGWQLSRDLFSVPQEPNTDLALRAAAPPAGGAALAAADGAVVPLAGSPSGQAPFGATVNDSSEFMIGDVWVTLVVLASTGSVDPQTENWTTSRIDQVKTEVLEGVQWWEDTLLAQFPDSRQELNISVDLTYAATPVPTAYEPINHGIADQALWIDSFLNHVGYNTAGSIFTDLDKWNHDQRLAHNADWALTAFVADSLADADGKFADGYFGYSYLGGPFIMMTYDNSGWGISRMGQVFAHEFAHIFYALDEYPGSNTYTSTSGYDNVQNLNAYDGNPNPSSRVASLMAESSLQSPAYANHTSSPASLQMIGWRDSDSDGVFDVLDVPLTLTGSGGYDAASGQYSFSGSSNVNALDNLNPNGSRHDITLNTVDTLEYRLDGGLWTGGNTYGAYSTNVAQVVDVSGLAAGTHAIEFRTIVDTLDVSSNVLSASFTVAGSNNPPVANDDTATANEDQPVTITVLANDTDADGDSLVVQSVTPGAHGVVAVNAGGTVTYTPSAGFHGSDSLTYAISDGRGGAATATVSVQINSPVKFFVVDNSADDTFRYGTAGQYLSRSDLTSGNTDPRGITTTADGQRIWVLNSNKVVYVYNAGGGLLGSWSSSHLKQPTGIATDGTNIWIVDRGTDMVYRYNGAASVTSGSLTASSAFKLTARNTAPEDMTTDGSKLWVVNSGKPDKVYVYNLSGGNLGSWTIDSANSSPTGLTLDPTGASQSIWIVDAGTDRVYAYADARSRTSGSQAASTSFALAAGNTRPQGIADPDGSLRALSAAPSPEVDARFATDRDTRGTKLAPVPGWWETLLAVAPASPQILVSVQHRADTNVAQRSTGPAGPTEFRDAAAGAQTDREAEPVVVAGKTLGAKVASGDLLAALAAGSRSDVQTGADGLFSDLDWVSGFDDLE
jgi:hypothetical protein